jgi:hypothetical protein
MYSSASTALAGLGKTIQTIAFIAALLGKTGRPAEDEQPPPESATKCAFPAAAWLLAVHPLLPIWARTIRCSIVRWLRVAACALASLQALRKHAPLAPAVSFDLAAVWVQPVTCGFYAADDWRAEWCLLRARRWPILIVGPVTVLTNWARARLTMHSAAPSAL